MDDLIEGSDEPFRSEREMRTLAESLDLVVAGRVVAAADLVQRFRAVEMAALEDGGTWKSFPTHARQARHQV